VTLPPLHPASGSLAALAGSLAAAGAVSPSRTIGAVPADHLVVGHVATLSCRRDLGQASDRELKHFIQQVVGVLAVGHEVAAGVVVVVVRHEDGMAAGIADLAVAEAERGIVATSRAESPALVLEDAVVGGGGAGHRTNLTWSDVTAQALGRNNALIRDFYAISQELLRDYCEYDSSFAKVDPFMSPTRKTFS
jgi:hypothetical protein